MDFGDAIKAIKDHKKVARRNWGGYWFLPDDMKIYHDGILQSTWPVIVASLKNGGYAPAQPYMEDMLAEDWEVVGFVERVQKEGRLGRDDQSGF